MLSLLLNKYMYIYTINEPTDKYITSFIERFLQFTSVFQLSFSQCREIADEQLTQILQASSLWAPKTSPHSPENPTPQSTAGNKQRTPPRTSQQPMKRRSITVKSTVLYILLFNKGRIIKAILDQTVNNFYPIMTLFNVTVDFLLNARN